VGPAAEAVGTFINTPLVARLARALLGQVTLMGTGTPSKRGGRRTHMRCRRCGRHSYHMQKKRCSACGYGVMAKLKNYAWAKAH